MPHSVGGTPPLVIALTGGHSVGRFAVFDKTERVMQKSGITAGTRRNANYCIFCSIIAPKPKVLFEFCFQFSFSFFIVLNP